MMNTDKFKILITYDNQNFGDNLLKIYYLNKIFEKNIFKNRKNIYKNRKRKISLIINNKLKEKYLKKGKIRSKNKLLFLFEILKFNDLYFIGGIFQDISSWRSFFYYFFILFISFILNKNIFFFSTNFEINSNFLQYLFLNLLKLCSKKSILKKIEVRDRFSLNLLKGIEVDKKLIKDPFDLRSKKQNTKFIIYKNKKQNIDQEFQFLNILNYVFKIDKTQNISKKSTTYADSKSKKNMVIFCLNKSYFKNTNKHDIEILINEAKKNNSDIVFFISDPKDLYLIDRLTKYKNFSYHIIRLNCFNLNSVINLLKITEKRVMWSQRFHILLLLKKYLDFVIIDSWKIESYFKTWYSDKIIDLFI